MHKGLRRIAGLVLVVALSATAMLSTGCDPTTQATVENGVITASQSLFASFLQAVIANAASNTTTNTTTST